MIPQVRNQACGIRFARLTRMLSDVRGVNVLVDFAYPGRRKLANWILATCLPKVTYDRICIQSVSEKSLQDAAV